MNCGSSATLCPLSYEVIIGKNWGTTALYIHTLEDTRKKYKPRGPNENPPGTIWCSGKAGCSGDAEG